MVVTTVVDVVREVVMVTMIVWLCWLLLPWYWWWRLCLMGEVVVVRKNMRTNKADVDERWK